MHCSSRLESSAHASTEPRQLTVSRGSIPRNGHEQATARQYGKRATTKSQRPRTLNQEEIVGPDLYTTADSRRRSNPVLGAAPSTGSLH